jgi:hypothetical protein
MMSLEEATRLKFAYRRTRRPMPTEPAVKQREKLLKQRRRQKTTRLALSVSMIEMTQTSLPKTYMPRTRQRSKDSTQPRSETLTSATAATEASLSAGDFTHPPGHRLNTPQSLALQNISSWPTSAGISSLDKVTGLVQASAYDNALPKRKSTKRGLIDRDELDRDIAPPLQKNKSNSRAIAFKKAVSTKVTTEPFAPVGSTDDKVNESGHTRKLRPRRNVKAPGAEAATDSSTF